MADKGQQPIRYIVNPLTNKPIKVGSKTFTSLVRQGVFNQTPLASVPEQKRVRPAKAVVARATDKTQAYRLKNKLEQEQPLPQNKLYSVGNDGRSIVIKQKKAPTLKPENLVQEMSKASVRLNAKLMKDPKWAQVLSQSPETLDQHTKDQLEHMILQELVANGRPVVENKKIVNNIKEVNNGAKKPRTKTFVLSNEPTPTPVRNGSSNGVRSRPIPIRRKPTVFSDTDCLTTDAYTTNYDEEEDEDDDATDFD
jgi:hypothetical protein